MMNKGILIAIGGNEDKGSDETKSYLNDFANNGILSRVVKESGGIHARIVVITTASMIPVEVGENYMQAFTKLNCHKVTILDIRLRNQAEDDDYLQHIKTADCVMFSGGDQSKIVDIIGGSTMHHILMERFQKENIVIAGTSAGAMAMSTEMISGGSSTEALFKGSVLMREGMGLIPELIIDTHFIKRGRFGRMAEAVAKFPNLVGIGLSEDTAMIISENNHIKVIGSGMIIIFDPGHLTHNNEEILRNGTPMTMANLIVHVLAKGDSYYLDERKVEALPMEAEF
jgi:cyanophycinase